MRQHRLSLGWVIVVALALGGFLVGCSKYQDGAGPAALSQGKSNSSANAVYPHPKDSPWLANHMAVVAQGNIKSSTFGIRSAGGGADKCIVCHRDRNNGRPMNVSCAGACHKTGEPSNTTGPVVESPCKDCHSEKFELEKGEMGHYPALQPTLCTFCHEPIATKDPDDGHLSVGGKKTMRIKPSSETCLICHENKGEGTVKHGALTTASVVHGAGEGCTNCHDPHRGSINRRYFLKEADNKTMCLRCHGKDTLEVQKPGADAPADAKPAPLHKIVDTASHMMAINDKKGCMNCHSPHGGNKKLLVAKDDALCASCHDKPQPASDGRAIDNILGKLSLPHPHRAAKMGCSNCHIMSPHETPKFTRLLNASFPEKDKVVYVAGSGDGNTYGVCFTCHESSLLEPGDLDTGFRTATKNLHAAHVRRDGDAGYSCRVCHDPHGTHQEKLVKEHWWKTKDYAVDIEFHTMPNGGSCAKSCHSNPATGPTNYAR